jgi:PAS domain-containing protein
MSARETRRCGGPGEHPRAFLHPERTQARIVFGPTEYRTRTFREAPVAIHQEIRVFGNLCGGIDVVLSRLAKRVEMAGALKSNEARRRAIGMVAINSTALPDGTFMAFCNDISDRKRAEERNELHARTIEALDQALIITDAKGKIVELNGAFENLYGYSRSEAIGKNPRILNPGKEAYKNLGYAEDEYHRIFDAQGHVTHFIGLPYDIFEFDDSRIVRTSGQ